MIQLIKHFTGGSGCPHRGTERLPTCHIVGGKMKIFTGIGDNNDVAGFTRVCSKNKLRLQVLNSKRSVAEEFDLLGTGIDGGQQIGNRQIPGIDEEFRALTGGSCINEGGNLPPLFPLFARLNLKGVHANAGAGKNRNPNQDGGRDHPSFFDFTAGCEAANESGGKGLPDQGENFLLHDMNLQPHKYMHQNGGHILVRGSFLRNFQFILYLSRIREFYDKLFHDRLMPVSSPVYDRIFHMFRREGGEK